MTKDHGFKEVDIDYIPASLGRTLLTTIPVWPEAGEYEVVLVSDKNTFEVREDSTSDAAARDRPAWLTDDMVKAGATALEGQLWEDVTVNWGADDADRELLARDVICRALAGYTVVKE